MLTKLGKATILLSNLFSANFIRFPLFGKKKKSDFIKKNFQRKSVNIIAATTGLSKETEIYPRKTKGSYEFSSLPTLNPDITTILFKNQFPEVFQKEKIEDC